jgi:hypothetical protein
MISVPPSQADKSFTYESQLGDKFSFSPATVNLPSQSPDLTSHPNISKNTLITEESQSSGIEASYIDYNNTGSYKYPLNRPASKSPSRQPENTYEYEIQQLKEQLRIKEEAARKAQIDEIQYKPKQVENYASVEVYNRINKEMFDKKRAVEAKKETFESLKNQIAEKEAEKNLNRLARERELAKRLEDLEKYRGEIENQRREQAVRAKEYGEHLIVQAQLRQELMKQEEQVAKLEPERIFEVSPPSTHNKSIKAVYDFEKTNNESPIRLTKKSPLHKTMLYNPITGSLKDTTPYILGSVQPNIVIKDPYPFIGVRNNQTNLPSELSSLAPFKGPSFTKSNPKIQPTNPITGDISMKQIYTSEFKDDVAAFFGVESDKPRADNNKSMVSYGNLVMGRSSPNVRSQFGLHHR